MKNGAKKFLVHFLAIYSPLYLIIGRDRISSWPDTRPAGCLKPDIRFPAGYLAIDPLSKRIKNSVSGLGRISDIQNSPKTGYPVSGLAIYSLSR